MENIVLSLGTNLENRLFFLKKSTEYLSDILSDMSLSPIYESAALLTKDAPKSWDIPFYNMAVKGKTDLVPKELLCKIKEIEKKTGRRENKKRWAPREIDIDILTCGKLVLAEDYLTIPHKELLNRSFFMLPLADLTPNWKYPVAGSYYNMTASEISKQTGGGNIIKTELEIND